jgi:hypothetical protein
MRVALFSDVITWIGEGTLEEIWEQAVARVAFSRRSPPDVIVDEHGQRYSNLLLQGGTDLLHSHPEYAAAYVVNPSAQDPTALVADIKLFENPFSTEGA